MPLDQGWLPLYLFTNLMMAPLTDFIWPQSTALLFLCCICLFYANVAFYRLYLSPLAKFPGPKLAALTFWVEFYHDVLRRGQYTFEIVKMHEKYGKRNLGLHLILREDTHKILSCKKVLSCG